MRRTRIQIVYALIEHMQINVHRGAKTTCTLIVTNFYTNENDMFFIGRATKEMILCIRLSS